MRVIALLLAVLTGAATDAADQVKRPNIVVILADDLGYGDAGCYNRDRGKIPTPHLDAFARSGMRFTDAHSSSSVCSPTRYSLLTGRYHWRTRLQRGIVGVWGAPLIAPDRLTIGSLAQQHGYHTGCIGKWHLGWDWPISAEDKRHLQGFGGQAGGGGKVKSETTEEQQAAWKKLFTQSIPGGPTTRGFDEYFGTDVPNWPPYCFIENDRTVGIPSTLLPAINFVKNQASLQGPALPGWQLDAVLPTLADRACQFITTQSKQNKPFLLYLPLTSPHTPIAVAKEWQGKSELRHPYADFVMQTDAVIGQVLAAIRATGVEDNTLVVITSDNGCASYIGVKDLEARGHFPSGPLRGYKADVWEGGHRIPLMVRWPGQVKPNSTCDQTVCSVDLLATFADVLGDKLPPTAGEDSVSLLSLLQGKTDPVHEAVVHQSSQGIFALRSANWKLVFSPDDRRTPAVPVQLYDLAADLKESKNLAADHPDVVARLTSQLKQYIADGRSTPGEKQKNDVQVTVDKSANTRDQPAAPKVPQRATKVSILKDKFLINDELTYKGRRWNGHSIEGLLLNSRMVQATFDDRNPATVSRWAYPDTQKWDADRNTTEFIEMMPTWRKHGLLAITLNLQGGSPEGYSKTQPWHNSAINADGSLDDKTMARLARVIDKADDLGMVVILGFFYFGQDQRLKDESAVIAGVDAAVDWLISRGYTHVLVEVNNECNVKAYDHSILKPARVHELIQQIKSRSIAKKHPLLVGTSYGGGAIPLPNVVKASDFLLLHGNGVKEPNRITAMVNQTRRVEGYRPMPILFNEDDHFDFDKPDNNFTAAVGAFASWGYFDYRMKGEGFDEGYQSVPVNWKTSSKRKQEFFRLLSTITGETP